MNGFVNQSSNVMLSGVSSQLLFEVILSKTTKTMLLNWIEFHLSREIYVKRGKGIRRDIALIECLQNDSFVPKASSSSCAATISRARSGHGKNGIT